MIDRKQIFTRDVEVNGFLQVRISNSVSFGRGNWKYIQEGHRGLSIESDTLVFGGKWGKWIFLANPGTSRCNININIWIMQQ